MVPRSPSSWATLPAFQKLKYWLDLWRMYAMRHRGKGPDFAEIAARTREFQLLLKRYTGRELVGSRALEIGYGQRPFQLFWLAALDCDVKGIDLDVPVLTGAIPEILETLRRNGLERALKTAVRTHFFDRREWRAFDRALMREAGCTPLRDRSRLQVGDAADALNWRHVGGGLDLIYSEDVFEHIPKGDLSQILALIAENLDPNGISVISPMIFTGISGGHLPEWYPHMVERDLVRQSAPWEHLRGDRFRAGTYLNRLSRSAWRELFATRFDIMEEKPLMPELGRRYLTQEVKTELWPYDDDELFSNKVRFVLRPRCQIG